MLNLSVAGLIIFGIPESLLVIWSVHVFARKEINKRDYFLSSILLLIGGWPVRFLPVFFGIHIIINIFFLILISIKIIKLSVTKAISCGLIAFACRAACDLINLVMLIKVFNVDIEKAFTNEVIKNLYGLPSVFIYGCIILLANRIIKRR